MRTTLVIAAMAGLGLLWPLGAHQDARRAGDIATALDRYAAGDFDAALGSQPFKGHNVVTALAGLDAWLGAKPTDNTAAAVKSEWARRATVAARFALDVVAQREITHELFYLPLGDPTTQSRNHVEFRADLPSIPVFDDGRFNAPVIAWACALMPKSGPVEPWEPWWWMTSIGLLQDAGEWLMLSGRLGESRQHSPAFAHWQQAVFERVRGGHLAEAEARLGLLPHLRLASAVVRSAALTDQTFRFAISGLPLLPRRFGRPDVLAYLEEVARDVNGSRFTEIERALEALLVEPGLEAEVALRIAQLRLMRRDWNATLRWLDRAEPLTDDTIHRATIDYFRGWVFERTNRDDEALAAYRAAYARMTSSPNLNTLLAAQLMRVGARAEAATVLEQFMREQFDHGRQDLWRILVGGEARHAYSHARRMREAR